MNVTYLGPAGATFTAIAYDKLAKLYGAPASDDESVVFSFAKSNEEVLPLLLENGGYGAIAMETMAEGKVDPPMNSFIELIRRFDGDCPIQVLGALRMKIHFALMVRKGTKMSDIKKVVSHAKSLGACRNRIKNTGFETLESPSNGKAAKDVSEAVSSAGLAALGPARAADIYGLEVLDGAFEDKEAVTTFYLLGPQGCTIDTMSTQRCLSVFRVKHVPGSLAKVLAPFAEANINLRFIHSFHFENGVYDFAVETESDAATLVPHMRAISRAQQFMDRKIQFGPFPVISG